MLFMLALSILDPIAHLYFERAQAREQIDHYLANPKNQAYIFRYYGSIQRFQNLQPYNAPMPPLSDLIRSGLSGDGDLGMAIIPCMIVWLLWPWLTLLSLFIFRASLRQAKINQVHVLRCVLYSSDGWLLAAPLLMMASTLLDPNPVWRFWLIYIRIYATALYVIAVMSFVMTYRLACAYTRFLHFHRAVATVISSQVIVVLIIINLLFLIYGLNG
jgi:hypothetical protein